jgi:hypothetical protein
MIDQVLLLLQAVFLLLLFLFLWWVVRSASRDLRLPQESFFVRPPASVQLESPKAHIVIERSPAFDAGASFAVGAAPVTIGRSGENAIAIGSDEFASARHARIEPQRDGLWIVDLGSTNGTYVNDHPIDGRERLQEGDLVRVGETELRVAR